MGMSGSGLENEPDPAQYSKDANSGNSGGLGDYRLFGCVRDMGLEPADPMIKTIRERKNMPWVIAAFAIVVVVACGGIFVGLGVLAGH
jgi:hypothetical protein